MGDAQRRVAAGWGGGGRARLGGTRRRFEQAHGGEVGRGGGRTQAWQGRATPRRGPLLQTRGGGAAPACPSRRRPLQCPPAGTCSTLLDEAGTSADAGSGDPSAPQHGGGGGASGAGKCPTRRYRARAYARTPVNTSAARGSRSLRASRGGAATTWRASRGRRRQWVPRRAGRRRSSGHATEAHAAPAAVAGGMTRECSRLPRGAGPRAPGLPDAARPAARGAKRRPGIVPGGVPVRLDDSQSKKADNRNFHSTPNQAVRHFHKLSNLNETVILQNPPQMHRQGG